MPFGAQERGAALPAPRLRSEKTALLAGRCGVAFLLGFTLAGARVRLTGAPFGVALAASAGSGLLGVCALLGACLGYLVTGGLEWGVRYMAASVLVYTVAFVFHELPLSRRSFFMPAAAALVCALTGFLGSFTQTAQDPPWIASLILETVLAGACCWFYREAMTERVGRSEAEELRHSISVMVLAASVLMSLSRLLLFETLSPGRVLALLLVMCSALKGGMLTGAAVGTVLGLGLDVTGVGAPFYTMAYAFCGLLSGAFGRHGRFLFALSFVCADCLAVVCAWNTEIYISALFETFCASVIFLLLPSSLLSQVGLILQPPDRGSGEAGLRRFVAHRVRELSQAYGELFETVRQSVAEPTNDQNIARVFDRAADQVCVSCKFKNRCWNQEYMDTLSAMNDATRAMTEHGSLRPGDLPAHFRDACPSLEAFVAAVNAELRALSYRRQLKARLGEIRSIAWGQYVDVAQVLEELSRELGSINGADPLAQRRLQRYLKSLDIDAETSVYRDGGGRLHVVIESGRLTPLTRNGEYLEKLSAIAGARLCLAEPWREGASRMTLLEAEPLAVSVGIAAMKKRGETVSGDKGSYFKTDAGVLCVLLSDGMGTGDEAAQDSARVVSILEKFLRSGVDPAVAMKILNSVLLLQGGDGWGCTAVDLMCVDLFSGETCFYKYGAAPSYVKTGKSIRRVKGETLAAGLSAGEGIAPDVVRMRLKPGSTALIASDGVLADGEDDWLKALLQPEREDMKELARAVLKQAETLYGASDDMTVLAVRVEERV